MQECAARIRNIITSEDVQYKQVNHQVFVQVDITQEILSND